MSATDFNIFLVRFGFFVLLWLAIILSIWLQQEHIKRMKENRQFRKVNGAKRGQWVIPSVSLASHFLINGSQMLVGLGMVYLFCH